MRDFIGKGLSKNLNVINIIRELLETDGNELYVPYDYVPESKKHSDPRVHFAPKEAGRPLKIMNIKGHSERFNVSITCLCDVKVEYEVDGKIELRDKKVWRSFNIIRDGELAVCKLLAKLTEKSYNDLVESGDIVHLGDTKVSKSFAYDENAVYTLQLEGIPLISYNWARPVALGFPTMQIRCQELQDELKIIRKYIKDNMILESKQEDSDIYSENIEYSTKPKIGKSVKCVTYTVKGSNKVSLDNLEPEGILELKKTAEHELEDLRFKCFCIKWAYETATKQNSFNWTELRQKRANSPKYYQEAVLSEGDKRYVVERCEYLKNI